MWICADEVESTLKYVRTHFLVNKSIQQMQHAASANQPPHLLVPGSFAYLQQLQTKLHPAFDLPGLDSSTMQPHF